MTPRIVTSPERKVIGKHLTMSFANFRVAELWKGFMPRRREIVNPVTDNVIALTLYQPTHFTDFKPTNEFEKWAAVEVHDFEQVPVELDTYTLPTGLYAVFDYKGLSSDNAVYQYIFAEWLPASGYALDHRPHLEVLGEKYRNNDPNSEEEIWIPIM